MTELYSDNTFTIFHTNDGYLLQNRSLPGFAHTHLKNYSTAKKLIEMSYKKKCPMDLSKYLLISLLRINEDEKYLERIGQILEMERKRDYYNKNKIMMGRR